MTDKQRVLATVRALPDDVSVEDVIERLCFLAEVQRGVQQLDEGQGVAHNEAKRRILGG